MIKSFRHKGLERFWLTGKKSGIQARHAKKLLDLLEAMDAAKVLDDIDGPGWRLHELKGIFKDRWSVTVNKNWRLTFKFENGDVYVINYEDYH